MFRGIAVVGLISSVFGAIAYLGSPHLLTPKTDWSLVRFEGKPLANAADARERVTEARDALLRRTILVRGHGNEALGTYPLSALGITADVDETVSMLERAALRPSVLGLYVLDPQAVNLGLRPRVESDAAASVLEQFREHIDAPPQSARLDLEHHAVLPEANGRAMDTASTVEEILKVAASPEPEMRVQFREFPPRVSSDFIRSLDISTVLASYETNFSRAGEQSRRGQNIDVASSKLDGLVVAPGETVSFNAVVGDRSEANGFKRSWEIFKGEMVEGIGGGTCQVASTFHAASFLGGLDVLERLPHSRPSAYIPMGLDSTVVYPSVDLKLRNPHPFPVVVHAKTEGGKLKVEILGKEKPIEVHFSREVVAQIPFTRRLVEEPSLSGKKVIHKQHGIRGFRIKRTRELRYQDGTTRVETSTDQYPPTVDIYQVPVGFDESLLPSLPGSGTEGEAAQPAQASRPLSPAVTAQAAPECTDCLEIVDGKGAHAPNAFQSAPSRSMRISR